MSKYNNVLNRLCLYFWVWFSITLLVRTSTILEHRCFLFVLSTMPWSYLQSFSFKIKWCLKWIENRWVIKDGCVRKKESHSRVFNCFCHVVPQCPTDWGILLGEADKNLFMTFATKLLHWNITTSDKEQDQNPLWSKMMVLFHISLWDTSIATVWAQVRKHEKVLALGSCPLSLL